MQILEYLKRSQKIKLNIYFGIKIQESIHIEYLIKVPGKYIL